MALVAQDSGRGGLGDLPLELLLTEVVEPWAEKGLSIRDLVSLQRLAREALFDVALAAAPVAYCYIAIVALLSTCNQHTQAHSRR